MGFPEHFSSIAKPTIVTFCKISCRPLEVRSSLKRPRSTGTNPHVPECFFQLCATPHDGIWLDQPNSSAACFNAGGHHSPPVPHLGLAQMQSGVRMCHQLLFAGPEQRRSPFPPWDFLCHLVLPKRRQIAVKKTRDEWEDLISVFHLQDNVPNDDPPHTSIRFPGHGPRSCLMDLRLRPVGMFGDKSTTISPSKLKGCSGSHLSISWLNPRLGIGSLLSGSVKARRVACVPGATDAPSRACLAAGNSPRLTRLLSMVSSRW